MQYAPDNKEKLDRNDIHFLSKKSALPWMKDACIDWAIITLAFIGVHALGALFLLPALLIIGNRQHALTVLGHEGAHFTLSASRKINDAIADILAFAPLGLTVSGYRNVHMKHHKITNMEGDPELAHRAARAPQWNLPVTVPKILKYAGLDLVGYSVMDYIIIVSFSKPNSKMSYLPLAAIHLAFVSTCLLSGFWWVAALWYLSLVTSFMMFFRLRTFMEHLGTDDTHRIHLNFIERFVLAPHNIGYHWEHHHYPNIAYHKLPIARKGLNGPEIMSLNGIIKFLNDSPCVASGQALKLEKVESLKRAA